MSITARQKQILNPSAAGYNYDDRRNKFIIDAIQERYLYFFQYPEVGEILNVSPSDNIEDPEITLNDLSAYFALYPQNGQIINGTPVELSYDEQLNQLRLLARNLEANGKLEPYSSKTSEVSYQQDFVDNQAVANLIAIPAAHSQAYKNKLRTAFSLPKYQYSSDTSLSDIPLTPQISSYMISNSNVDLYDWRNNCLPGSDQNVYYNSIDESYYFTSRTDEPDIDYMGNYNFNTLRTEWLTGSALPRWAETPRAGKELYNEIVSNSLREVLLATGKNSEENYSTLANKFLPPSQFRIYNNIDTRPGSRWVYAVKLPADDIDRLPLADSPEPSREEVELTPLQKAKILTGDKNKSTKSIRFLVEDMLRYLPATRDVIKNYDESVIKMGISDFVGGIDFSRETDNLRSFFSLLELFCNYNKIALVDSDRVEMFFTDNYELDHVIINGTFYYQGTGTRTYLNPETEYVRVLNAFSVFTPTTFSLIESSREIYNLAKTVATENKPDVLNFMTDYMYPKPDLEKIKEETARKVDLEREQKARRDKVFQTFKRITQGNSRDFEFLYSNRPLRYSINSTLQNMDCDSGQAAAIGYALKFWQAAMSKTKLQSVIRQTIILLRDEVVDDETTKRIMTESIGYVQNPDRVRREVSKYINQQISCSLDVLGDFLEDQFLDPLGLPPQAATLSRTTIDTLPTIDFKKCEMVGVKPMQSKIYQKMIETVIMNWLKSIVAGLAKDFIRALLGCGPNDPEIELTNPFRKEDYGFVNLLDYIETVDLVEIAERVGLKDFSEEPPREVVLEQMTTFVEDISYMVTPVELQQLLTGDASRDLLLHIHETVSSDERFEIFQTEIVRNERVFRRTRGLDETEEITTVTDTVDPNIYNSINFTIDNITLFFISIGAAMQGALDGLGDAGFSSPLEAFCSKKDGFVSPITLNLSVPEIEAQYNEIVTGKLSRINNLCGFLKDLTNLESQIQRLIENLPGLEYYNDLLQDIADISNQFAEWLAKKFSDLFGEEQTTIQGTSYNLYNSKMGTELFYQIFWSLREVLMHQLYFSSEVTYFQTPAGFGSRTGFHVDVAGEDDWLNDESLWSVDGNFGARRNAYTRNNVYTYIWSDPRNNTQVAPPRLDVPQYRSAPVPHADSRDVAYYSIPNSPRALRNKLGNLLLPINTGLIGSQVTGDSIKEVSPGESGVLRKIAIKTYEFIKEQEDSAPYSGHTGATYLRCSNDSGGNISINFVNRPNTFPRISHYNPGEGFYNEISISSSAAIPSENGDFKSVDYRIFNGVNYVSGNVNYPIRIVNPSEGSNLETLKIGDVLLPPLYTGEYISSYADNSIGLGMFNSPDSTAISKRSKDALPISNYTTRIDSLIDHSVTSEIGRRRMPRYISALNEPALQKSDDICITAQDLFKAEAALKKVQSNLGMFFINIMPMASAYPQWRSVGTVEVITDYLHRRLTEDLEDKSLLGPFYTLIPFIEKVYPYSEEDPEFINNPPILSSRTPSENLISIVRCVYVGMLNNIAQTSEYDQVNKSVFDHQSLSYARYRAQLKEAYNAMFARAGQFLPAQQLEQENGLEIGKARIQELYDDYGPTDLGMMVGAYYFPVAFQIASYMMYMDRGIRYAERFTDTAYRLLIEQAAIDDSILTAVKGQSTTKFLQSFTGFPVVIENYVSLKASSETTFGRIIDERMFERLYGPSYNPNYNKYLWDQTSREATYYNTKEVENRIHALENLQNIPLISDYYQRLGQLSYADQIPYFSRSEQTGRWEFENSIKATYFRYVLMEAFAVYVDGYGPNRSPNRARLRTYGDISPRLSWETGEGEDREEGSRLEVAQFAQVVNSDQFNLTTVFSLAADLLSAEGNHLNDNRIPAPFNFVHRHQLKSPHAGGGGIPASNVGIPLRSEINDERDTLYRFFSLYEDHRRGREEEDRIWEAVDSTYGNDNIGTNLTPAGWFLGNFFLSHRSSLP